ncbi:hypothetical protein AAG906_025360 [Vitis piasezkii]
MAWLLNSRQLEIGKPFYLSTAKEMWEAQDLFVTAYHNTLKVLSQELDLHQLFIMGLTEDVATLAEIMQLYSYVHAEESKRSVMMGPISQETSALKVIQENRRPDGVIIAIRQGTLKKPIGS